MYTQWMFVGPNRRTKFTGRKYWAFIHNYVFRLDVSTGRLYLTMFLFSIFTVAIDEENEKIVLDVQDIRLSLHKEVHPEDSDLAEDIGLSSEEKAHEMEEQVYIARKFVKTSPAPPPPPPQPAPPTTTVTTATTSTSTEPEMASVHVPVAALQQVHQLLGQMLGGNVPAAGGIPVPPVP